MINQAETPVSEVSDMMGSKHQKSDPGLLLMIKRWAPVMIIIMVLAGMYVSGLNQYLTLEFISKNRQLLMDFVAQNYALALGGYFLVYTTAVAVSFPGASLITIVSGFLFGWFAGGLTTIFAATLGASIIFLVARTSIGALLQQKAGKRLSKLSQGFRRDAFNYLLILRLAPVFPFWIINLAPALFGMKLLPYVIATFIGIIPGTFAYAYLGQGLGTTIDGDGSIVTPTLVAALALLALVSAIPIVVKRWKRSRIRRNGTFDQ